MHGMRRFEQRDDGAVLVETALAVVLLLLIALPFGLLLSFAGQVSRDVAVVHAAARELVHTKALPTNSDLAFTCGERADEVLQPCPLTLARGSYVAVAKDTIVDLAFGISLHTNARAIARVG